MKDCVYTVARVETRVHARSHAHYQVDSRYPSVRSKWRSSTVVTAILLAPVALIAREYVTQHGEINCLIHLLVTVDGSRRRCLWRLPTQTRKKVDDDDDKLRPPAIFLRLSCENLFERCIQILGRRLSLRFKFQSFGRLFWQTNDSTKELAKTTHWYTHACVYIRASAPK